jgi:TatD DNase family protein
MLIDSHAHIQADAFDADRAAMLDRAVAAGVGRIVVIGSNVDDSREGLAMARADDRLVCTVGVHPHDARLLDDAGLDALRGMAADANVRAIGEIGLDFHYDFSPRDRQREAFASQLALAAELGLPVVIHVRESEEEAYAMLRDRPAGIPHVVMHCFLGDADWARRWLDLGCVLGVGGAVTFKKMDALREAVAMVPLDRLLLETDCPYMAPAPHRGRRNEPAYVPFVCEAVALAKGLGAEAIAEETTANAERVFGM